MMRTTAAGQVQETETKGFWIWSMFGDTTDIVPVYLVEDRIPESGYVKYTLRRKKKRRRKQSLPLIHSSTVGI